MVFLAELSAIEDTFVYGVFGVQYEALSSTKKDVISALYKLLSTSAGNVDCLRDEDHGITNTKPKTITFIAYWLKSSDYQTFKESTAFQDFWASLHDESGVFREIFTVPKSRCMFAASQPIKNWGLGNLLELKQSNDEGYWGVYRHRLSQNPDAFTDPDDKFTSPCVTVAKSNLAEKQKIMDIPSTFSTKLISGRVLINDIPDNLCFVREGQRQQHVPADELEAWMEHIAPHAQSWITHLDQERNKNGVVAFTTHVKAAQPQELTLEESDADAMAPVAETDQLAWFIDLAHFEKAGRAHKGHVELRKTVMGLYGPGGRLSQGKAELFVELCVLKGSDVEAEYVGCMEGTGLLFLR